MSKNSNLHAAKNVKNDEFYTQYEDIEKECKYYSDFFRGKVVYCNCDDARKSNFFKYFAMNFETLGLKKLITTGFNADGQGVIFIYDGAKNGKHNVDKGIVVTEMKGDGDFRSEECIEILKEADVVVTNPPFSLFREYVAQLMKYNKKFLIIGNGNAVTYKEIFPLIKENKMWMGASKGIGGKMHFIVPDTYQNKHNLKNEKGETLAQVNSSCWFTNIDHNKRHEPLVLYKKYSAEEYPTYDNYDAIESKTAEIPMDYDGVIGVPITFLDKYCPEQFELVKFRKGNDDKDLSINGKCPYFRILIRPKK